MTTDLEFLDEVTAFLDTEMLVPVDTPRKSFGDGFQQLLANGPASWANISSAPSLDADPSKETEGENYKSSSSDVRVEAEHNILLAIVNSQGAYIESMGIAVRECPKVFKALAIAKADSDIGGDGVYDQIDDVKWLRLKSSVSALYTTYLHEVDYSYTRVDQVFRDAEFESLPIGVVDSSYRYKPNGDVEYFQHRNRLLQPFDFDKTCRVMWDLSKLTHRQLDREVYHGVPDPENTVGVQFRLQKTLLNGLTVSIMKHVVARPFVGSDRVVIVWKIFSEGEGIFSGMDTDETGWVRIRPQNDESKRRTLMEFCARQIPVPYLAANASDPVVKEFQKMMEDAVKEDEQEVASKLGELLVENTKANYRVEPRLASPVYT